MKLFFAADHAGFSLKEALKSYANSLGHEIFDLGTDSSEPVDYPNYASKMVPEILKDPQALGVLICGTGIGMSIAANRFKGIRAAVCNDSTKAAYFARAHNHANILCLGGRLVQEDLAKDILKTFLETPEEQGRHNRRVKEIDLLANEGVC